MPDMDRDALEAMVRQVLIEKLGGCAGCGSTIKKIEVPRLEVTEADRMDTGNPGDRVWTHDLFRLSESPRLGAGLMVMERTSFPWTLNYDEMDYVIEGRLEITMNGQTVSAGPGEVIYIPKGSAVEFSVQDKARFLYFVYPADWQKQQ